MVKTPRATSPCAVKFAVIVAFEVTDIFVNVPVPIKVKFSVAEFPASKTDCKSWALKAAKSTILWTVKFLVALELDTSVPINKSVTTGDTISYYTVYS